MSETTSTQTGESMAGDLQFERAQFTDSTAATLTCGFCQRQLTGTYFEVNGQTACPSCRVKTEHALGGRPGPSGVVKAIGAGVAAGVAGAVVYYAVAALTGYEFGLIAVLVGFMVGYAVRWASGGRGGALYQAIAICLTYLSIVGSYAPFLIQGLREPTAQQAVPSDAEPTPATAVASDEATEPPTAADAQLVSEGSEAPATPLGAGEMAVGIGFLVVLLLASPLLGGIQNLLGLLIIGFGLFEAWKLNKRTVLQIAGPFQVGRPATDLTPAP